MDPIKVETDPKKGYIILHKCRKCGEVKRNRTAHEADVQPDSISKIIKLTAGKIWDVPYAQENVILTEKQTQGTVKWEKT